MEARPIFSALLRNKTGAALIALQIAFTLAVVVNALFIIVERIETMNRPTGMDVDQLFVINSTGFAPDFDARNTILEDLAALRALPGVENATTVNQIPLSGGGDANRYVASPDAPEDERVAANNYLVDEHGIATLGVELAAGRNFTADEIQPVDVNEGDFADVVIVTQALADELFPDGDALGRQVYNGIGDAATIVGILKRMQGAWVSWDGLERVMLHPQYYVQPYVTYMIRAEPGRRDAVMPVVEETLAGLNRGRILRRLSTHSEIVANSYSGDRAMAIILTTVIVLLIVITGLGIVGLASFSVRQRTKQIGTRRAIGARRFHIMRYFLVENWMITTAGIVAGSIMSILFNVWLVAEFELPKLEFVYLLAGIVVVLLLGQLAVLAPARRAAAISPAIATRNV